jgi:hypothetical protein
MEFFKSNTLERRLKQCTHDIRGVKANTQPSPAQVPLQHVYCFRLWTSNLQSSTAYLVTNYKAYWMQVLAMREAITNENKWGTSPAEQVSRASVIVWNWAVKGFLRRFRRLVMSWTIDGSVFDTQQGKKLFLLHDVQTGSGAQPASYPMGAGDSFRDRKAVWVWSWPLAFNKCQGQGKVDLYVQSP